GGVTLDISTLADDIDNDDTAATLTYALDGQPTLGSASISGSTVTFTAGAADFEYLADGEITTVTIPVSVSDGNGGSASADITVTVTGTNDDPVISLGTGSDEATLSEGNAALSASGTLDVEDIDVINTVSVSASVVGFGNTGSFGPADLLPMFGVDAGDVIGDAATQGTINWTFNAAAGDFDFLDGGDTAFVDYRITATDSSGATDTYDVRITINGTNDDPVVTFAAGNDEGTVSEDDMSPATATGTISFVDADADDGVTSSVAFVSATGQNGATVSAGLDTLLQDSATFTISQSGTAISGDVDWSFSMATGEAQYLNAGESVDVVYNVSITDGDVIQVTPVTITIEGQNDTPTLATTAGATPATENGSAVTVDLSLLGDDADAENDGTSLTYAVLSQPSEGGASITGGTTLSFDPTGGMAPNPFEDLALNETRDVSVVVRATDAQGDYVDQTFVFQVTGINDIPTIDPGSTSTDEDTAIAAFDLTALADDVDSDDDAASLTYTVTSISPSLTTGSATTSGTDLVFDPGSDFQYLADGESATVLVDVQVMDSHTATALNTVTITVTGNNDAPQISIGGGSASAIVTETNDPLPPLQGTLTLEDADVSDVVSTSVAYIGETGTGETNGIDVSNMLTATGGLSGAVFQGTIEWTFNAGSETFDHLDDGDVLTLTYRITATDDTVPPLSDTQDVTITITGTNDTPTLAAGTGGATEDGGLVTAIDLTALGDDADLSEDGDSLAYTVVMQPSEGSAAISADGNSLEFNPGTAFQDLNDGESRDVTVRVRAADSAGLFTEEDMTITVTGTNDDPVATLGVDTITLTDTASDDPFDTTQTMSTISVTDADTTATHTYAINGGSASTAVAGYDQELLGTYSNVYLNTMTGAYLVTHNDTAIEALQVGDTPTESVTFTVTDDNSGTGTATLTINLTGANDTPDTMGTLANTTDQAVAPVTLNLLDPALVSDRDGDDLDVANLVITDLNGNWTAAIVSTIDEETGVLTIDPTQFRSMDETQDLDLQVAYDVIDGNGGVVPTISTINVDTLNDAPFLLPASDLEGGVAERADGAGDEGTAVLSDTGIVEFDDFEPSDTHSVIVVAQQDPGSTETIPATGNYIGTFSSGISGSQVTWTFTLTDSEIDSLGEGDTITQTHLVRVVDQNDPTSLVEDYVTITITGTNDQPVITSVVGAPNQTEGADVMGVQTISASTTFDVTDADFGGTIAGLAQTADILTPSVTGDATVVWSGGAMTPEDVSALGAAAALTITAASESAAETGNTFNAAYSADAALDWLTVGETVTVTYTLQVQDDSGAMNDTSATQTLSIVIEGSNDAPVITVETGDSAADTQAEGDTALTASGTLTVTDVDVTDSSSVTLVGVSSTGDDNGLDLLAMMTATGGVASGATTGAINWSFDSGSETFDHLDDGDSLVITYTITVTDGAMVNTSHDVTITINGEADAAVVGGVDTGSVLEAGVDLMGDPVGNGTVGGTLTHTDADADDPDNLFQASTQSGTYGDFELLSNGTWTYTLNDALPATQALTAADSMTETFTVMTGDGTMHDVSVTVNGSNDAPTLAAGGTTSTDEDTAAAAFDLSALAGDVDSDNDATTLGYAVTGTVPVLTTGSAIASGTDLLFNPGSDFQYLAPMESATVTVTVEVTDAHGATAINDVTVTVTGTNDAPDITVEMGDSAADTQSEGNAALTASGTLSVEDVDLSDASIVTTVTVVATGDTGGLDPQTMMTASGGVAPGATTGVINWAFDSGVALDHLDDGDLLELVYTITVEDSFGGSDTQDVTITINGTNDVPTLTAGTGNAVENGPTIAVDLAALANDLDADENGSTLTYNVVTQPGEGSATIVGTDLVFDPGNDFQDLFVGETRDVTVRVSATDAEGDFVENDVVITVTGTNDDPTLGAGTMNATEGDTGGVTLDISTLADDID
ncbi:VCBS domain-containing protein, partial [Shimia sp. SDUM112013]|uniref:VCBS domain-containing protein n=1 Tax=Shimia sp. SDUM112013 TaxID=3136160 RepID=UPI0032EFD0DF